MPCLMRRNRKAADQRGFAGATLLVRHDDVHHCLVTSLRTYVIGSVFAACAVGLKPYAGTAAIGRDELHPSGLKGGSKVINRPFPNLSLVRLEVGDGCARHLARLGQLLSAPVQKRSTRAALSAGNRQFAVFHEK